MNGKKHARAIMPFILVVVMWNSLLFTLHAFYVSLFDTHMFPTLHLQSRNNPIIVSAIAIFVLAEMESSLLSRHLKVSYIYIVLLILYAQHTYMLSSLKLIIICAWFKSNKQSQRVTTISQ